MKTGHEDIGKGQMTKVIFFRKYTQKLYANGLIRVSLSWFKKLYMIIRNDTSRSKWPRLRSASGFGVNYGRGENKRSPSKVQVKPYKIR
ncbi:hypothetical protein Aconfl_26150 [Algoriphagus confluentis]|uniref:Uncharacterized protein n=1 Tax=Algoriphagus confluentis TaxID=1697556 RepID=A0ABQ6PPY1_9BACT|nr:hypothetical protein Aconfl_26150 [Algoriphagus confluentis]